MLKGKRIVVTGGAGFIGSHLVDALVSENDVIVLDDFSSGRMENLLGPAGHRIVRGSVTRPSQLRLVLRGADVVFHLAARPSVPGSVADPQGSARVNLDGTLNVLVASRDCGVRKVVFSSSCAVYGDALPPVKETTAPNPRSPYAVQKLAAEHYCLNFQNLYGLSTVCLRYFNVFGPRQDPASQYAAVVPVFFRDLLGKGKVTIFGDGRQTRDFIFVHDVVRANLLAAEKTTADGAVLNIATGKGTPVNVLAREIAALAKKALLVKRAPPREGDIKHSYADITRATKLLGFAPRTALTKGLRIFRSAM